MIELNSFFAYIKNNIAVSFSGSDSYELISRVESAIKNKVGIISTEPDAVSIIWPWIEKRKISLIPRFFISDEFNAEILVQNINLTMKKGASGAHVFIDKKNMDQFLSCVGPVCADLFFNKDLFLGFELSSIQPMDMENMLEKLLEFEPKGLSVIFDENADIDFVGSIYGFINALPPKYNGGLHFMIGNVPSKIEQVWRLVEKLRPNLLKKIIFFING